MDEAKKFVMKQKMVFDNLLIRTLGDYLNALKIVESNLREKSPGVVEFLAFQMRGAEAKCGWSAEIMGMVSNGEPVSIVTEENTPDGL